MTDGYARKPVSTFPVVVHRHAEDGREALVRFRGAAARDGLEVACEGCRTVFVYRKPVAGGPAQESGPRTHF